MKNFGYVVIVTALGGFRFSTGACAGPQALRWPPGFSLMLAYQRQTRQTAAGEDGEEFHFEVAEGTGEGAEGGRYMYVCVRVGWGESFLAA